MQTMLYPMVLVLLFAAIVLIGQIVISTVLSARSRRQRVNRRLTMLESGMAANEVYETLIRRTSISRLGGLPGRLFNRFGLYLGQTGLAISPVRLLVYGVVSALGLWLVASFLFGAFAPGSGLANGLTTLVASFTIVGVSIWIFLSRAHALRLKLLEEQLPLALDIITRAIRAGHPVVSAVQLVTQELGDPIGSEFGLIVDETTYGFEFREALANFARRTGSEDAHFFAVSVGIQAETGGNLAEILMNLASVIRGRITLGKRVQALASEGKMSAIVLSVLPIFLVSFVGLTQPSFYTSKFNDPIFWPVVVLTMILYGIGQIVMNRIVNIKY